MRIECVSMVRNEVDIIEDNLLYNLDIFDHLHIADMQSSDGTRQIIDALASSTNRISVFNYPYLTKHQAECGTFLSKAAFERGADWVFFLDADEFLKVDTREELEVFLANTSSSTIHLPWINLIPQNYGTFTEFDFDQDYFWSGRTSQFSKIAISGAYYLQNPSYSIDAGNHYVKSQPDGVIAETTQGLPLYHIPVRSVERIAYKLAVSKTVDGQKHNRQQNEANHMAHIGEALQEQDNTVELLNGICMDYGAREPISSVNPKALDWPSVKPKVPKRDIAVPEIKKLNSLQLQTADGEKKWRKVSQPKGASVRAAAEGSDIVLRPQAMQGDGKVGPLVFGHLSRNHVDDRVKFNRETITTALRMSMMPPPFDVFSAWTDLVPAMGMIFTAFRPRRYVELGTHNGMSFFSACQFSEALKTDTECIAIDSWEGDPHAGTHTPEVFTDFLGRLEMRFPTQMYLRTYFDEAAGVFDDGSIDLLHIDGFHSYEAVKSDFETWLPKMSDRGVMIFHDTNVHERGFGVWRFWQEVAKKYPNIELKHGHGLGILFVGSDETDVSAVFKHASDDADFQTYLLTLLEAQIEQERIRKGTVKSVTPGPDQNLDRVKGKLASKNKVATSNVQKIFEKRLRVLRRRLGKLRAFFP